MPEPERPDLTAWRRRDELRRGSRTTPIPAKRSEDIKDWEDDDENGAVDE